MNKDQEIKKELIKRLSQYVYFSDLPDDPHTTDGDLRFKIQKYIRPNSINEQNSTIKDITEAIKNSSM